MKRVNEEEDIRVKKFRVCDESDGSLQALNGVGSENLGEGMRSYLVLHEQEETFCGESLGLSNVDGMKKDGQLVLDFDLNVVDVEEDGGMSDFDLNTPAFGTKESGIEMISEKNVEVVDITSDESDAEEVIVVDDNDNGIKGKQIEEGNSYENLGSLSLGLGTVGVESNGVESNVYGCGLVNGERRYSRADKGKSKVDDCWLSLANDASQSALDAMIPPITIIEPANNPPLRIRELDSEVHNSTILIERRIRESRYRDAMVRYREVAIQSAGKFARSKREDHCGETLGQEEKDADKQLGCTVGPFSTALEMVRERNLMHKNKPLIEWIPSVDTDRKTYRRIVPSLLELSLKLLAENAMAIVSLDHVPDTLRRRLVDLLCNVRSMNVHILNLLVEGSPTEIRIKDCHWLTDHQLSKTFGNFDMKNLRVLQLDLCGQCTFDYVFGETFGRCPNSLPNLGIISLKGACRLSDDSVKALVISAPALRSINLSQCSLLTETGINFIADSLGPILKELYIDECQGIDAMLIVPALLKCKHLEVLSVAGVQTVSDQFVNDIVTVCGQNLKDLNLADCFKLTNDSLKVIGSTCVDLQALNISKLEKLTDVGIEYLANGCRSLQTLKLHGNRFSDEAIAAFLEVSGKSMKELSLNNISKVGYSTALSLAKCSRNLLSLDLSWCRRISNEALGLIVDSCLSLRLVKLFGCTQITEVFLNGHSNSTVQIVGLSKTPLLDNVNMLEPEEVLLRYSPLPSASNLLTVDSNLSDVSG